MPRLSAAASAQNSSAAAHLPLRVAVWLLDSPRLGRAPSVKRFAGRLLKQPALHGVVSAQSRLGRLLCCDCGNPRDRRIGVEMLRQAARAGDQANSASGTAAATRPSSSAGRWRVKSIGINGSAQIARQYTQARAARSGRDQRLLSRRLASGEPCAAAWFNQCSASCGALSRGWL